MKQVKLVEELNAKKDYDVIVAGGGLAGIAASVSARRMGKRVLLIEKTISLGGLATIGLINLFVPMCNGRGKLIVKGMCQEFLQLAVKYGYNTIPDEWKNGEPKDPTNVRYVSRFSAPIFSLALTELVQSEGVDLLLDTVVSMPVMNGNYCEGLTVENKSGREYYTAKVIVDTTGDGDVLYRAGVPMVQGGNYYTYYGFESNMQTCEEALNKKDISKLVKFAHGGRATLYGEHHPEGMKRYTGTDVEDVTEFVVKNQLEALNNLKATNPMTRDLVTMPTMAQYRTTRHIDGDYTLTTDDEYRHFEDSVGAICDFDRRDYLFEVPYRTMIKRGFDNLITAGRTASGEGYGWDVLRVIPPAIITGQAAGIASALSIDSGTPIHNVDITQLQAVLSSQDVLIHFENEWIPETEQADIKNDIGHI